MQSDWTYDIFIGGGFERSRWGSISGFPSAEISNKVWTKQSSKSLSMMGGKKEPVQQYTGSKNKIEYYKRIETV